VVFVDIPAGNFEILHLCQRNEIPDRRRAAFGPFPKPYGAQLCQRADRFSKAALKGFQTGNKGRRDRSHTRNQYSELFFGGRNSDGVVTGQSDSPWRSKCYNSNSMRDRATATLTTVVVDDEKLACDELCFLLRDFPELDVIATGSNGLEAVD